MAEKGAVVEVEFVVKRGRIFERNAFVPLREGDITDR